MEQLKLQRANLDSRDGEGRTPLMHAAYMGDENVVQHLLERDKVDMKARNNHGETALMYAARAGHLKVLQMPVSPGAPVDDEDHRGATALGYAAENGHTEVVELLLHRCESVIVTADKHGYTPLSMAVFYGHIDVARA